MRSLRLFARELRIRKKFINKILKDPLYKPLYVKNENLALEFNDSIIDTCYHIHKSMIGILDIHYDQVKNKLEVDHLINQNVDLLSAALLHCYFTQWLSDVKKMNNMAEGNT